MVLGFNREATVGIGSSALLARQKQTVSRWGLVPALLGLAWSDPVLLLHAHRPALGQRQRAREAKAIRSNCPHKRSLQESKLDQRLERFAPRPLPTCKTRLQANSAAAGLDISARAQPARCFKAKRATNRQSAALRVTHPNKADCPKGEKV